jgi:hypothetical protein
VATRRLTSSRGQLRGVQEEAVSHPESLALSEGWSVPGHCSGRHEENCTSGTAADAVTAGSKDEGGGAAVRRFALLCRLDHRFSTGSIQCFRRDEKPVRVALANHEAAPLELVHTAGDRLSR